MSSDERSYVAAEILSDVDFVVEHWDDLIEHRTPGTARPWRQALLDPDERQRRAERDRAERESRDPDAPGFTSAPQHIDVLDAIVNVWMVLDELTALVSPDYRRTRISGALTRQRAEYGPARVTEIDGMVDFLRTWLPETACSIDGARLDRLARRLRSAVTDMTRLLGLLRAGQLLNGALCPWCEGRTPKHPEGGAVTMRVEEIPGSHTLHTQPAAAVVCWNPLCTPGDEDCGIWFKGRPAWPWHEWEWLEKRLIITDPPVIVAKSVQWWTDQSVYAVQHSGRSGIDAAVAVVPPDSRIAGRPMDQPGEPVRFLGGPFAGQLRLFIRIEDVLAVTRPQRAKRNRLVPVGTADSIGEYRFEIVNDQPTYVWQQAS